jgi:hypothetical protein
MQGFSTAPWFAMPFINFLKIYGIYPNFVTLFVSIVGGILLLYGFKKLMKLKGENIFLLASFLIFLLGYMGLYSIFPFANFHFSRWIVLMPIITTIIITKALDKKIMKYLAAIFLISQILLFLTFPETSVDITPQQNVAKYLENKEGRALYLPKTDYAMDYLLPKYGIENAVGFFYQGISPKRLEVALNVEMYNCIGKSDPLDLLYSLDFFSRKTTVVELEKCTLNENASDELLRMQNLRYVIINNRYPEVVSRFENDSNFAYVIKMENFTIMEMDSGYVQTDSRVSWAYSKKSDRIELDLSSNQPLDNISVRISEAWYPNWKSDEVDVEPDNLEYMTFSLARLEGTKHITIEYVKPVYQKLGELITVLSWVAIACFAVIKRKELFHLK